MTDQSRNETMGRRIARAAQEFERSRTGIEPRSVSVVQSEGTLVITVHGALSPAERALSRTPAGAAQVQDYHRRLFASGSGALREEIKKITGVDVREATAEVDPDTGTVVAVFSSGTVVQVYLLASGITADDWNAGTDTPNAKPSPNKSSDRSDPSPGVIPC